MRELPRYQCHKIVKAAKIVRIELRVGHLAELTLEVDGDRWTHITRRGWLDRCGADSRQKDCGYFVEYEDGFTSWSPTDAFENGYERII